MVDQHTKVPDHVAGLASHLAPQILGENDNNPASARPVSSAQLLRIEADGRTSDFLVSPADEEQLMALIGQISAAAEAREETRNVDRAGWRAISAIATLSAIALISAYLYV